MRKFLVIVLAKLWYALKERKMKIRELFENDDDKHQKTLDKTGFWGSAGAGCIFLAKDTGNLLIAHRGMTVEQPNTWGSFGGAIDSKENPVEALKREVFEETGFSGHVEFEPLYVFKKGTFTYYNFLAIVDREFKPKLDWENQGYVWCTLNTLPTPLHFGLIALLNDKKSLEIIKSKIEEYSKTV
jgi:8-oxo-dGTP pyrophosphatase MutT (NUDIX family)